MKRTKGRESGINGTDLDYLFQIITVPAALQKWVTRYPLAHHGVSLSKSGKPQGNSLAAQRINQ
jgi:hypothetical protein